MSIPKVVDINPPAASSTPYEKKIKISQLCNPQGSLPPSLAYVYLRAREASGIEAEAYDARIREYVIKALPNARSDVIDAECLRNARRFISADMNFLEFTLAMALLGFEDIIITAK